MKLGDVKLGLRVAVRRNGQTAIRGTVITIGGEELPIPIWVKGDDGGDYLAWAENLRRLVPKNKPREWWIVEYDVSEHSVGYLAAYHSKPVLSVSDEYATIYHVRETSRTQSEK